MPGISLRTTTFLLLSPLPCCLAQHGPVPIEPLLRHSEPRLVALGAWEMLDRQDDTYIPLLLKMVERWDPAQRHGVENEDAYDAMAVILDVLIQRNQAVSPAGVTAIADAFPDQALILAARLPMEDAEPILFSWYQAGERPRNTGSPQDFGIRQMKARVAAMILVANRPADIAAGLVADSEERLAVSVPNSGAQGVDRCLMQCDPKPACVAETADEPRMGWPPIHRYVIEEDAPWAEDAAPLLVAAGGNRITYRRVPAEVRLDACYFPDPLGPLTRHRLLAEMLQVNDESMPWSAQMNLTVPWMDDREFLNRLTDQIHLGETRLRATVSALFQKGLLTKSQMAMTRPRFTVLLFDDRQPAQPAHAALPLMPAQDPRTTCRISQWR